MELQTGELYMKEKKDVILTSGVTNEIFMSLLLKVFLDFEKIKYKLKPSVVCKYNCSKIFIDLCDQVDLKKSGITY